jgi:hypothetical protein
VLLAREVERGVRVQLERLAGQPIKGFIHDAMGQNCTLTLPNAAVSL